jgi:hypothetical protein
MCVILVGLLQLLGLDAKVNRVERTLARNPVLSGFSMVFGERLYFTMIEGWGEVKSSGGSSHTRRLRLVSIIQAITLFC